MTPAPVTREQLDAWEALGKGIDVESLRWPAIEVDLADDGYPANVAAYIASLDPPKFLALIARVRELEGWT